MTEIYAIINATPDSFFAGSRVEGESEVIAAAHKAMEHGADVLDIGGYSTRPGFMDVPFEEELRRLDIAYGAIRRELGCDIKISIDTFRSDIVRRLYDKYGEFIVNDIEGGVNDKEMYSTVGKLSLRYVMMSSQSNIDSMKSFFETQIQKAREYGVKDIMLDPGFGFGKTLEENYTVLRQMESLKESFSLPIFVGLSRKSMIWRPLKISATEALNGTTALNLAALERGASILRVHDVAQAKECITLYELLKNN